MRRTQPFQLAANDLRYCFERQSSATTARRLGRVQTRSLLNQGRTLELVKPLDQDWRPHRTYSFLGDTAIAERARFRLQTRPRHTHAGMPCIGSENKPGNRSMGMRPHTHTDGIWTICVNSPLRRAAVMSQRHRFGYALFQKKVDFDKTSMFSSIRNHVARA